MPDKRSDKLKMANGSSIEKVGTGEPLRGNHPMPSPKPRAECGCQVAFDMSHKTWADRAYIVYCPLHASAAELVEALEMVRNNLSDQYDSTPYSLMLTNIDDLLRRAKGESK